MSRWWTERAAMVGDIFPGGLRLLGWVLVGLGVLTAIAWYTWPAWLPPWRWAGRRKRPAVAAAPLAFVDIVEAGEAEPDRLPDLPAEVFASLADRYAAEGRFAEAVRERLRAMVRRLVDHGLIDNQPGRTVTELSRLAGQDRPALGVTLGEATTIFSDIWYGERPAVIEHDQRMRELASRVDAALSPIGTGRR